MKICDIEKRFFTFSFPVTLTFVLRDLKFAPLVTLVQRYIFKLEVSSVLLFRESEARNGRTYERGATCNATTLQTLNIYNGARAFSVADPVCWNMP